MAEQAILSAPGVLAVEVDYNSREATIGTAAGSDVPRQEILAALAETPYRVVFADEKQEEPKTPDGPVLPKTPLDYTTLRLPAHVNRAALKETDSTPADNPITDAGATLGRVLFYDTQLSANNTISCASCHLQKNGFADPERLSKGFDGGRTGRNATNIANVRFSNIQDHVPGFFWDERAATLEIQALMPIQDKVEMGMTLAKLERRVAGLAYYPSLFKAAFGSPQVTSDRIAKALAQFMRAMVTMDAAFDRAAPKSGDYTAPFAAFSEQENLGKSMFMDGVDGILEHGCAHCHVPPTFNMARAHNIGLDMKYKDQGLGARKLPKTDPFLPSNDGKFKASSLRNIELSAPYMHDGRFKTLQQVVDHYSEAVQLHENLTLAFPDQESAKSPSGLKFTAKQKAALVAFLKTLTDKKFVTDPRFSDPFVHVDPAKN
ncbi:MAG: cytochrome-c peroxidase [Planctomycetes bacterium]|nr:cytochrome-c peroxidase [Planctomycetota bacterium]